MAEIIDTGVQKYLTAIAQYDKTFDKWSSRVTKIIKRYRDDTRTAGSNEQAKFNVLWSNVQTLIPAVYARLPKADVSRRFGDNDPIGRVASLMVERALDYEIEHYPDFRATMRHCVEDRFLGGRGVAWVRYEPHVKLQDDLPDDGLQVTEDIDEAESEGPTENPIGAPMSDPEGDPQNETAGMEERPEEIEYECAPVDYVHWKDFGHTVARTWEEVTAVWRWVYMDEASLIERFGEKMAKSIPMESAPDGLDGKGDAKREKNQAKICEIWDKTENKVFWLCKDRGTFIDERDDPLELKGFFPCPRPLFATMTSDSLVPVPDFVLYQDQANELDIVSDRIDGLVKALRVRGVYDATQPALQRLLTEGGNNDMIPVDKWMAFSEKNGLKGSIDLMPLDMIAGALSQCYQARADIKAQIYEITGISDIVRGQTAASETATAQQIKGQYAGLRLRAMQEDVALFATQLLRLKTEIICSKFQPETILQYAAVDQLSPADQQMVPQAIELLKSDPLRSFRVDVAADSLVQIDENQTKTERMEFLAAVGGFLEKALPVAQSAPQMVPMIVELMKFGVGAFKQGRQIEGSLDVFLEQFKQAQAQPQQAPPDPEMVKAQAEQAKMKATVDMEKGKAMFGAQVEQQKHTAMVEFEKAKAQWQAQQDELVRQHEAQMAAAEAARKDELERWKVSVEADTRIQVAQIAADSKAMAQQIADTEAEKASKLDADGNPLPEEEDPVTALQGKMELMHQEAMDTIINVLKTVSAPKRVLRGPDGRVSGVEIVH